MPDSPLPSKFQHEGTTEVIQKIVKHIAYTVETSISLKAMGMLCCHDKISIHMPHSVYSSSDVSSSRLSRVITKYSLHLLFVHLCSRPLPRAAVRKRWHQLEPVQPTFPTHEGSADALVSESTFAPSKSSRDLPRQYIPFASQ